MAIAALFSAILGGVFWVGSVDAREPVFKYWPPVICTYFVPMLCTTAGVTPAESPVYDWMSAHLLVADVEAGYGRMGVLIFLSAYQAQFDGWMQAVPARWTGSGRR